MRTRVIGGLLFALAVVGGLGYANYRWRQFAAARRFPARAQLRPDVVGCWALLDSDRRRAQGRLFKAPSIMRLDSNLATHVAGRGLASFDSLGSPIGIGRGWEAWSADSASDTVRASFSNGFSRSVFVLSFPENRQVDTARGRAYEFWDFKAPSLRGKAYAVRVGCPR